MAEKTFREHQSMASRARWAKLSVDERKEYSKKLNEAKALKKLESLRAEPTADETDPTP